MESGMEQRERDNETMISVLSSITGALPHEARSFLENNSWQLEEAAAAYYNAQEEEAAPAAAEGAEADTYTGPRTLDGRPAPQTIPSVGSSSGPASRARAAGASGGIATLGSIGGNSNAGQGQGDDDSDDEEPRDLFAGGEKSGLAVQDPKNNSKSLINDILKKAKANTPKPPSPPATAGPSRFRGPGTTLGGDDTPSRTIADPNAGQPPQSAPQTRILHIWEDGFSVDDGDLCRFDDPQHSRDLSMIRNGRAPLHLMGVAPGQPVDVQLNKHDEKYKKPKGVYKPFSGSGQRLGSPTPGPTSSATSAPAPAASAASHASSVPGPRIDESEPTVLLRLQLIDGTRLNARFNATHTVGDVYDFINRASPANSVTPWVLATTFPNKDHADKSAVLSDLPEFKKGGTAVQKRK